MEGLWDNDEFVHVDKNGNRIGISEIEPGLYLGSLCDAGKIEELKSRNIQHIVQVLEAENMCPKFPEFNYHFVCLKDAKTEDLGAHLEKVLVFINSKLKLGENVFVHCQYGISRSCSFIVAYLMVKHKLTYKEAYARVKAKRPIVRPNSSFRKQLEEKYKELLLGIEM